MFNIGDETVLVQHKTYMYRLDAKSKDVVDLIDGENTEEDIARQLIYNGIWPGMLQETTQHIKGVLNRLRMYGLVGTYPDAGF